MEENARHALHRRLHNESHTTTLQHQSQPSSRLSQLPVDDASSNGNDEEALVLDCPTASLVVSTTTIDVTVYVTEEPTPTSTPCDETTTSEVVESTSTTDCEEETPTSDWSITTLVPSDFFSEPCETTDSETTSDVISHHHSSSVTSTPTTPCETDSTPTTSPYAVTSPPTPTTTTPPATTTTPGLCIDTTIVPVTTSKLTVTVAAPPEPTRTVCIDNHETGTPADEIAYCGVPGKPAGVYFIAEFIEERSGVPVTEEGCYQFCDVSPSPHPE